MQDKVKEDDVLVNLGKPTPKMAEETSRVLLRLKDNPSVTRLLNKMTPSQNHAFMQKAIQ